MAFKFTNSQIWNPESETYSSNFQPIYWYWFRSCLRLIICFLGTIKYFFYFWKWFSCTPKLNISRKQDLYRYQWWAEVWAISCLCMQNCFWIFYLKNPIFLNIKASSNMHCHHMGVMDGDRWPLIAGVPLRCPYIAVICH